MHAIIDMLLNPNLSIISLFEDGDRSTFLREMGRFYLVSRRELSLMEDIPPWVKENGETLIKLFGMGDTGNAALEKFASDFELYLMDGSAKSRGLTYILDSRHNS